jgi:S-formylglutathione hydrolase FrmB
LQKDFYVYTPPGYDQAKDTRYPVLYLFRGHESEWINKNQDSSRNGHNVIDVYESLLAAHQVGPMILVFPGMSSSDNTVNTMLTDLRDRGQTKAPGIGWGIFESYFLHELMPYVDAHYRTIATPAGRGVDGFSLGGFMSTKIAAKYPDLFSTVGAFDGLYFYADSTCKTIDTDRDTVFSRSDFWPVFGHPADLAFAAANNPANLVCNSTPEKMGQMHWFIQYGPESGEPNNSNYYRGVYLVQQLQAKGVQNGITPILTGGHNWATADEHMRATLPLHWAALNGGTGSP